MGLGVDKAGGDQRNFTELHVEYYSVWRKQHRWTLETEGKEARHKKANTVWFCFYEVSLAARFTETEMENGSSRRLWGAAKRELLFIRWFFGFIRPKSSGGPLTTGNRLISAELYTYKWLIKMVIKAALLCGRNHHDIVHQLNFH